MKTPKRRTTKRGQPQKAGAAGPSATRDLEVVTDALVERGAPLFRQLQEVQEQARRLGLFPNDRDLLACPNGGPRRGRARERAAHHQCPPWAAGHRPALHRAREGRRPLRASRVRRRGTRARGVTERAFGRSAGARTVESDGGPRTYTASPASIGGRACQIPARTVSFLR
jgi:hypothetical protein